MRALAPLAAVVVTLAAGCGGSEDGAADPATATTTALTATVSQYASIVAEHRPELAERLSASSRCLLLLSGERCHEFDYIAMAGIETFAARLGAALTSASAPSAESYIGAPPDEIADLVERTIDATDAAADAFTAWSDGNCAIPNTERTPASDCTARGAQASFAGSDVEDAFAAWEPYL